MLVESVYFPALAAMLFDACATNAGLKAVLLKQAAAYAKSLRPLELFGEPGCRESLERVVEVLLHSNIDSFISTAIYPYATN